MPYNRVLNDTDRETLSPLIQDMVKELPDLMGRKYPRANVQQAFAVDFILNYKKLNSYLCVGCYEDSAYEYLKRKGYDIEGIDPIINYDLHTFVNTTFKRYDCIFSVSIIEHVERDEEFVADICSLLNKDGIAIITMDFREEVGAVPVEDYRLYRHADYIRLERVILNCGCELLDAPELDSEPDFQYGAAKYSFSTLVLKKK